MIEKITKIVDWHGDVVATVQVAETEGRFAGLVDLDDLPARLRETFDEYEDIVNSQMFSLLDEIEERIENFALKAVFEDGADADIADLQIFPSTRRVSFRVAKKSPKGVPRPSRRALHAHANS